MSCCGFLFVPKWKDRPSLQSGDKQTHPESACLFSVQVLYLLDVVRNGIKAPNLRLPFTVALFIAKAALQILKPGTIIVGEKQTKLRL